MIFQKATPPTQIRPVVQPEPMPENSKVRPAVRDEVETVVGPSVNVEGDFASEGNIIVKGSVTGSVHTSKHLSVEQGAKIMANVRAGSVRIAGEVRGNMKVQDTIELTATARVLGDIEAKIFIVEAGAVLFGKVSMPGIDGVEQPKVRNIRSTLRRNEESQAI
jgi:cytoskeletal protein CcmA (bactofilin family)